MYVNLEKENEKYQENWNFEKYEVSQYQENLNYGNLENRKWENINKIGNMENVKEYNRNMRRSIVKNGKKIQCYEENKSSK